MIIQNRKYYVLNWVFLMGLFILLINDHYLKFEFSNWLTGKLSDFAGLLIFPMFLSYFFPKTIKTNLVLTGLFFIFWKSPYSQSFIAFYNQWAIIPITRVVDYSDLWALLFLPLSYFIILNLNKWNGLKLKSTLLKPAFFLLPAVFIFMATSPPKSYYYNASDGDLQCTECKTKVKYSKTELLELLKENDFKVKIDTFIDPNWDPYEKKWRDSIHISDRNFRFYRIDTIIIEEDTITHFQFALQPIAEDETIIWINGMNIQEDIPNDEVKKKLTKYYEKLLKKQLKKTL